MGECNGDGIDLAAVPLVVVSTVIAGMESGVALVVIAGYWDVGIDEPEAGFAPETTAVFRPLSLPKRAAVLDGRQGWAATASAERRNGRRDYRRSAMRRSSRLRCLRRSSMASNILGGPQA